MRENLSMFVRIDARDATESIYAIGEGPLQPRVCAAILCPDYSCCGGRHNYLEHLIQRRYGIEQLSFIF